MCLVAAAQGCSHAELKIIGMRNRHKFYTKKCLYHSISPQHYQRSPCTRCSHRSGSSMSPGQMQRAGFNSRIF